MLTFPYTPGFVHGSTLAYAVQVNRFRDATEQRYLLARSPGKRLSYEFARPSSSLIAGVVSFYQAMGGPVTTFVAVDHRDVSTHTVRFAAPTLDHFMGPTILNRALRVDFVREEAGTTPVATTYVPTLIEDFCDAVVPTSGVVSAADTGTREGWTWVAGPVTVTPTQRYFAFDGRGGVSSLWQPSEFTLPGGVTLTALTLRVYSIGSAGSVRVAINVNGAARSELVAVSSASLSTTVATGTITTSGRAGTLACLVSSLSTAVHTLGATIVVGVAYTHP